MRQDPQVLSFNAGELSPYMVGRPDVRRYASGCEKLLNFIPSVTGALRRRPGTLAIDTTGMNINGTLIPFIANADGGAEFLLNVTTLGTQFFHAPTRSTLKISGGGAWLPAAFGAGGSTAALATPWTVIINSLTSECYLQWAQSNDVMWITHPNHPPVKIKRIGTYEFTWSYMGDGYNVPVPFNDVDPLNTVTMQASAPVGIGITVTAGAATFTADHVGTYLYLEQPNADTVKQWEAGKAVGAGERRRSNGRNYVSLNAATTGTIRPTHSRGSKYDGDAGVQWDYNDDGYGVVYITAIGGGGLTATANVVKVLPNSVVAGTTTRWARGAWSASQGYPSSVCFFRERLCFARDQTLWTSVAGDFENFTATEAGLVTADLAVTATIAANTNDRIQWLHPMGRLIAGTRSTLYAIGELATTDPFGPGNVKADPFGGTGTAKVPPLRIGDASIFVARGGARVFSIAYDFQGDGYKTADLTVDAEHIIGQSQFTGMTYARNPDNVVWFTTTGKRVLGMTQNAEQEVLAWHQHELAGYSLSPASICAVMGPDGKHDDVWMLTYRPKTLPERGALEVIGANEDLDVTGTYYYHYWPLPRDQTYLDYHRAVSLGAGAADIPTPWLPVGSVVQGLLEGCVQPEAATTSAGYTVEVAQTIRKGRVGFAFSSYAQPMPLIGASATGSPHAKKARIHNFAVRLYQSGSGFRYGKTWQTAEADLDRYEFRKQDMPMDTAVPLFTGDVLCNMRGGHEDRATIFIEQDQPFALNVLCIFPSLTVEESR